MTHLRMPVMKTLRRRTLLRSAAAIIPLPLLDAVPSWADAPTVTTPPQRLVWLFQSNGMFPRAWNPTGTGRAFQFSETLAPFAAHRERMTVLRNLTTTASGNHVGKCSALLTGVQVHRDRELGIYANAKSLDQWVADRYQNETPFASIQLGIERPGLGYCSGIDTPVSYGATLSWSDHATRLMPETSPRRAFDRLFRRPSPSEAKENARWRGSVLDAVSEQASDLRRGGSTSDRRKMDEYLESVRSVERQLTASTTTRRGVWSPPTKPSEAEMRRPGPGVPGQRDAHMKSMLDLITLALWTDSTRVATLMMANTLSDGDFSFLPGVNRPFHSGCSHHQNKPDKVSQYVAINRWHASQSAYLCDRLAAIDDGDGSVLDNSLVFFGSSLKDGNAHSNRDLPIVMLGGGAGRIRHHGHLDCGHERNIADLHHTVMKSFDIDQPKFNGIASEVIHDLIS